MDFIVILWLLFSLSLSHSRSLAFSFPICVCSCAKWREKKAKLTQKNQNNENFTFPISIFRRAKYIYMFILYRVCVCVVSFKLFWLLRKMAWQIIHAAILLRCLLYCFVWFCCVLLLGPVVDFILFHFIFFVLFCSLHKNRTQDDRMKIMFVVVFAQKSKWISMMTVLCDGYFMFYCLFCCAYRMISFVFCFAVLWFQKKKEKHCICLPFVFSRSSFGRLYALLDNPLGYRNFFHINNVHVS